MTKTKKKQRKKEENHEELIEEMIHEKLATFKDKLSEDEIEMQKEALKNVFIKGRPPRHVMGISPDFMNLLYMFAFNAYNTGHYEDARQTFEMLNFLEPLTPKYLLALAAAHHKLKEFKKAIENYLVLSIVEHDSPIPYFHIADCCQQLEMPEGVQMGLAGAISRCGDDQRFAKLKGRCYAMLSIYKKE